MRGNFFEEAAVLWGVGRLSSMPGTLASCIAAAIFVIARPSWWLIIVIALAGIIASDRYSKRIKKKDPKEVVIDEVVGTWIALYGHPIGYVIAGLFLFRVLDIFKPFPISWSEKAPGGWGIMADDFVGGVMTNLILCAVKWLYFEGGFVSILTR